MGRQKRAGFGSPYLLHDPAFGVLCKVRDEMGDWGKPAGYAWGEWLHDCMEEAERRRLLYVACTRAADLLILSGQAGKKNTWLSDMQDAWNIEDGGTQEDSQDFGGFSIKVFRPSEPPEIGEYGGESIQESAGINQIPILAQPFPVQSEPQPVAVTRLSQLISREEDESVAFRPAMWSNERPARKKRAPGYLVGNIVHKALANWDCLTYPNDQLYQLLENYARQEGVFSDALSDAVQRSHQMLSNLKKSQIYRHICQAQQRFHEVPFSQATPTGILHGIIDLLFQDDDGTWHLLDWKTEWSPRAEIEENAQEHLLQMAVYANAAQKSLGIQPRVGLCFLSPNVVMYQFSNEEIDDEWSKIFST